MSGIVERVARKIAYAQLLRQYKGHLENIGCVIEIDRIWPEFIPEARSAIAAIREPTEEMHAAGHKALYACMSLEPGEGFDEHPVDPIFKAMIDAAFTGKE